MKDWMKKGVAAGLGLAIISKERAEKAIQELVKKGEMTPKASRELLDQLITRGEQEQKILEESIQEHVGKTLRDWNVATQEDIRRLEQHIHVLESRLSSHRPDDEIKGAQEDREDGKPDV
ncbi:phasin family protein [Desmospora profundinema]|uniref:Polyhydroxyalkanoate synthesis regulator phasin n=1 Tax=Desmospora profundinema TaxID=1571184 RepID=A0ABU1IRJ2_9BACL|nr:polyhydroxyalkanoate synthesis regulator [Desmospora profundinema]MDR6227411.1 polyhydroxyalkanoate synthesis regulator phasin [Desmospora profundinema]